ncbi:NAD-dependent epimerase/dehydratase family protein [Candidatus Bathyarchaeota archaeon]|nr:NAD-dependent epimerase/dehydratase family protein [Candidatus Bathyarchaeota archaeon]NIU81789.1 NAD-dependent epimerase/dehydratase family protein [Candidatus Bathyarchaeota archaeon]NIV68428.1 NAD-dependent epimerase/dehydratase family protein [Candidatus Bathyarchaeota archaeon]NIW16727.1 NAD-dependent epimerase/dehydratase family protein [Candidatus Bathyarchaeota archaeon]NIW34927.1 NAD-dependent epimerase/dehydratase family protein [Candidatus Bathyarchaeota archaeon]
MDEVLVTGGAGFIGSHLVDDLMHRGCRVTVVDNLSKGRIGNLEDWVEDSSFTFVKADLKNQKVVNKAVEHSRLVFHLAANPEVRVGETCPDVHFKENLRATFNILEAMRRSGKARIMVFTSTSTVFGEPSVIPTPEEYGPLIPISTYGATKLGCEALISSYAYTFGLRGLILRLANIVGSRADHGVIPDFIRKLEMNPRRLEILGDGRQEKSYLHIEDCVGAVLRTTELFVKEVERVDLYNVGSTDQVTVKRIAEIVAEEMGLEGVSFDFTGGVEGGRGWKGDVKEMQLSVEKLCKTGWRPRYDSEEAVRLAVQSLL